MQNKLFKRVLTGVLSSALTVATALPVGAAVVPSGAKTVKKIAVTTAEGQAVAKKGSVSVAYPANAKDAGYIAAQAFMVELTGKGASKGFKVKDTGNALVVSDGESGIIVTQATAGEAEKSAIKITSKAKNKKGKKLKFPFAVTFDEDKEWIAVESVEAVIDKDTIEVGETAEVTYTVKPEGVALGADFESDNEAVATVDGKGIVTGVGAGKATISVTVGEATGTVDVTVVAEPEPSELVGVSIDNTTPKVDDTLNAITDPVNATGDISYAWFLLDSNEQEIPVGAEPISTEDSLTVTSAMKGKFIAVVASATYGEGEEAETVSFMDVTTAKVTEDTSAKVTLADADGLQSNGTGLVADLLRVSYGSALGTPQSVTWYYNDTVVKAYTNQAGDLTNALALETAGCTAGVTTEGPLANCKDGVYYVVIVNTAGESFTSNELTLVYDEEAAVTTSATFSDDLTNKVAGNLIYAAADTNAIVSIKTPKTYAGIYYIYDESTTSYTTTNAVAAFTYNGANTVEVSTADKMTEKNALDGTIVIGANKGIQFTAENGETTIMLPITKADGTVAKSLTRGKKYKVAFDQASITTDDIGTAGRKDIETTDAAEMAYLTAPASIKLVSAAKGTAATAQLLDAEGNVVSFIGDPTAGTAFGTAGFDSVIVYGNTSATDSTNVAAQGGAFKAGNWASDTPATGLVDYNYYKVVAKTTEGVYGEKSVELKSDFKAQNIALAAEVKVAENGTTPAQADITLKGVVANSKVYVVAAGDAATKGAFDPADSGTYRGFAEITPGLGTATVANVFKKTDIGDTFTAYLVPDDADTYARVVSDGFTLAQTATSLAYDPNATASAFGAYGTGSSGAVGTDEETLTANSILVKDQFGTTIDGTGSFTAINDKAADVKVVNAGGLFAESATAQYNVTAAGVLSINLDRAAAVDYGDGFDITLLGSTLSFRAATILATGVNGTGTVPYTVKLGTTEVVTGNPGTALTLVANTDGFITEVLNSAAAYTKAGTAIEADGGVHTIAAKDSATLGANDTLKFNTAGTDKLVVTGKLKVEGEIIFVDVAGPGTAMTAGDITGAGTIALAGTDTLNNSNWAGLMAKKNDTAGTYEIATDTKLAAHMAGFPATTNVLVDAGVKFETDNKNLTVTGTFTNHGTTVFGSGTINLTGNVTNDGTFTAAAASAAGNVTFAAGSVVNITTGLTLSTSGATATIDPTATLTKCVLKPNNTATNTVKVSDGTNTITLTQANGLVTDTTTVLNATTAAAGDNVLTGGNITVTTDNTKLTLAYKG